MSNGREIIKAEDVLGLVEHFMRNSYKAKDNDSKVRLIVTPLRVDNAGTSVTRPLEHVTYQPCIYTKSLVLNFQERSSSPIVLWLICVYSCCYRIKNVFTSIKKITK